MAAAQNQSQESSTWNIVPAIAAWVVPGLGHILIGEKKRGLMLLITILSLWLGGLLIGGIGTFDRSAHPAWSLGQAMLGPSIVANYVQESMKNSSPNATIPGEENAYQPPYGHVESQAVLYTALAGLLNLLCIIDVIYRDSNHRGGSLREEAGEAKGGAGEGCEEPIGD